MGIKHVDTEISLYKPDEPDPLPVFLLEPRQVKKWVFPAKFLIHKALKRSSVIILSITRNELSILTLK